MTSEVSIILNEFDKKKIERKGINFTKLMIMQKRTFKLKIFFVLFLKVEFWCFMKNDFVSRSLRHCTLLFRFVQYKLLSEFIKQNFS